MLTKMNSIENSIKQYNNTKFIKLDLKDTTYYQIKIYNYILYFKWNKILKFIIYYIIGHTYSSFKVKIPLYQKKNYKIV